MEFLQPNLKKNKKLEIKGNFYNIISVDKKPTAKILNDEKRLSFPL